MESTDKMTNCPNCGAPIEKYKCDYCGTYFIDVADIKERGVSYLRMQFGDETRLIKARLEETRIKNFFPPVTRGFYGELVFEPCNHRKITLTFTIEE